MKKVRQNYRFYPAIDFAVQEMAERHKTTRTKVIEALIWKAYNDKFTEEDFCFISQDLEFHCEQPD